MLTLCTYANGERHPGFLRITLPVWQKYAERYGYRVLDGSRLPVRRNNSWAKFDVLGHALCDADVEWAVWFDADTIPVNHDIVLLDEIQRYTTPMTHCVSAIDWNGLCSCFFAVRNCLWTKGMLEAAIFMGTCRAQVDGADQGFLKQLTRTPEHSCRISYFPTAIVQDQSLPFSSSVLVYHGSLDTLRSEAFLRIAKGDFEWCRRTLGGLPHGVVYV